MQTIRLLYENENKIFSHAAIKTTWCCNRLAHRYAPCWMQITKYSPNVLVLDIRWQHINNILNVQYNSYFSEGFVIRQLARQELVSRAILPNNASSPVAQSICMLFLCNSFCITSPLDPRMRRVRGGPLWALRQFSSGFMPCNTTNIMKISKY